VDALMTLRKVAGMSDPDGCDGSGDVDCDDDTDARDALVILRFTARLAFAQTEGCPAPGS
jgi:hypothetical protein